MPSVRASPVAPVGVESPVGTQQAEGLMPSGDARSEEGRAELPRTSSARAHGEDESVWCVRLRESRP